MPDLSQRVLADQDTAESPGVCVNGVSIPESDILQEAQHHPADTPQLAYHAAARALAIRELLAQEARRLGIVGVPEPGDAEDTMETIEEATFRTLMETEMDVPVASIEECRRYYMVNPEKLGSGELYEARHILLAAAPGDTEGRARSRSTARRLADSLQKDPDRFSQLAREYSDCPSSDNDGSLGQLTRGSTVFEFEQALATMQEGDISQDPVESRFGFHIIALDRKAPGTIPPFEVVHDRIAAWLGAKAWSAAASQYIAVLAGKAQISGTWLESADSPLVQ